MDPRLTYARVVCGSGSGYVKPSPGLCVIRVRAMRGSDPGYAKLMPGLHLGLSRVCQKGDGATLVICEKTSRFLLAFCEKANWFVLDFFEKVVDTDKLFEKS